MVGMTSLMDWQQTFQAAMQPWVGVAGGLHLQPTTVDQIRAMLGFSAFQEQPLSVSECDARQLPSPVWLDVSQLNAVLDYSPANLTITVETGMTLGQLNAHCAADGLRFALDFPDKTQLIDVLAMDATAFNTGTAGYPRDWVLGLEIITANGNRTKCGGKVMKNVTGYDLAKLYVGSHHSLGVVVQATLKLLAIAETERWLKFSTEALTDAAAAAELIADLEFMPTHRMIVKHSEHWEVWVGYSGYETVVTAAVNTVHSALAGHHPSEISPESVSTFKNHWGVIQPEGITLQITLPKDKLWGLASTVETMLTTLPQQPHWQLRCDVPWIQLTWQPTDEQALTALLPVLTTLADHVNLLNGAVRVLGLPHLAAATTAHINFPMDPLVQQLNQAVKHTYDPAGVLYSAVLPFHHVMGVELNTAPSTQSGGCC